MNTMKAPGFGGSFSGFSLGQQMAPPTGSGIRVSVWDAQTDDVIPGAVVTATRLDGVGTVVKDTTGEIGTAILAFPDAPVGTPILVEVSARGYRKQEFQIRTVSRAEAETLDPAMGYVVDLERSSGLAELLVLAGVAGMLYWALS